MARSRSTRSSVARVRQLTFERRGGKRSGAGRKPKGDKPLVAHSRRPRLTRHVPVLVTMKLVAGLPSLRRVTERQLLHGAFRIGGDRLGLRLVHFSIQSNHVHAIVEAQDASALSRGLQGLAVRIARALNRHWTRRGRVFADRFHARPLRTPLEVRYALAYVLNNARKHHVRVEGIDPCASGAAFDGWSERVVASAQPVLPARCWLLTTGWRKHGRIRVTETPGGFPPPRVRRSRSSR